MTVRRIAAAKTSEFKEGDRISLTITGYIDSTYNGYGEDRLPVLLLRTNGGYEIEITERDRKDNDFVVTLLESGETFKPGDVVKDVEGYVFYMDQDRDWMCISADNCDSPIRPLTRMKVVEA